MFVRLSCVPRRRSSVNALSPSGNAVKPSFGHFFSEIVSLYFRDFASVISLRSFWMISCVSRSSSLRCDCFSR